MKYWLPIYEREVKCAFYDYRRSISSSHLYLSECEYELDKDLAISAAKLLTVPPGGVHCLHTVASSKAWTKAVTNYIGISKANLLDSLGYLLRTGDWQLVLIESKFFDEFYGLEVDPDWVEFQRAALTLASSNV